LTLWRQKSSWQCLGHRQVRVIACSVCGLVTIGVAAEGRLFFGYHAR
jgi:hypothetical protein